MTIAQNFTTSRDIPLFVIRQTARGYLNAKDILSLSC